MNRPPASPERLVHHDYQQFNVLWARGRLSGVVDWVWASRGPQYADVVHAGVNLCLLYGACCAIAFQSTYEALVGERVPLWWNVAALVDCAGGWSAAELQRQAGRRIRIDAAALPARLEELLVWAFRRG